MSSTSPKGMNTDLFLESVAKIDIKGVPGDIKRNVQSLSKKSSERDLFTYDILL